MAPGLDDVILNLDASARSGLSFILALMMFSVGLGLRVDDFRRVLRRPGIILFGTALQVIALPALTFLLTFAIAPTASIALGMMVVAACPGGNASNVLTQAARGDTALSVSLTALSSALAVLTTPFNIVFWAGLHPRTASLLSTIGLDRGAFLSETALTLGLPLASGLFLAESASRVATRIRKPLHTFSLLALGGFIVGALVTNGSPLAAAGWFIFPVLVIQDAMALALGYGSARLAGLDGAAQRAFTFETGIRNSGLGLVILLGHFKGLGGAALITAGWGVWHLISGGALAAWWSQKDPALPVASALPLEAEPTS
ncbi:MAG: bile acid:sodium symporter family protein [Vicinamibacteria bacterium]|nr:bile acid:sodium symporter family protein [Vicinamibacteria bacterium]